MSKIENKYPDELKHKVASEALVDKVPIKDLSEKYDIPYQTVLSWVNKIEKELFKKTKGSIMHMTTNAVEVLISEKITKSLSAIQNMGHLLAERLEVLLTKELSGNIDIETLKEYINAHKQITSGVISISDYALKLKDRFDKKNPKNNRLNEESEELIDPMVEAIADESSGTVVGIHKELAKQIIMSQAEKHQKFSSMIEIEEDDESDD